MFKNSIQRMLIKIRQATMLQETEDAKLFEIQNIWSITFIEFVTVLCKLLMGVMDELTAFHRKETSLNYSYHSMNSIGLL